MGYASQAPLEGGNKMAPLLRLACRAPDQGIIVCGGVQRACCSSVQTQEQTSSELRFAPPCGHHPLQRVEPACVDTTLGSFHLGQAWAVLQCAWGRRNSVPPLHHPVVCVSLAPGDRHQTRLAVAACLQTSSSVIREHRKIPGSAVPQGMNDRECFNCPSRDVPESSTAKAPAAG